MNISHLLLSILLFFRNYVLCNTETFQIKPTRYNSYSDNELLDFDGAATIDFNNRSRITQLELFQVDHGLYTTSIEITNVKRSVMYYFKICWSAIKPVEFTKFDWKLTKNNSLKLYIEFVSDSYPTVDDYSIPINISIEKTPMPTDLLIIVGYLISMVALILFINYRFINFYKFFIHI
ncbi:hypothetical protein KAFR_0A07290 [Kazachstania africana CBS 2517]|uniref:Uncharacterized protein n=1 Tax=Kazachstania africana (strain ATCC 22294 / BCRC 22015 / CBS 2517 / CECT 1963 / NBRC 1671 / NRRL Y-8276) TaxID=1071382 RepID=H2AP63_KAZAF|nr:hypothetical protein KAFR_0A07290 [Kazachstania africana CBS 2517]CCF56163.1 hypothetical protein KAFR_0A07290 [Kazachstania africana CBS 2517]